MSEANIYGYRAALEDAIAFILRMPGNDLEVSTPRTAGEFQKKRPRIDLAAMEASEKRSFHYVSVGGRLQRRNASWSMPIHFQIVCNTQSETDSNGAADAYKARFLNIAYDLPYLLNTTNSGQDQETGDFIKLLPCHEVQDLILTTDSADWKPQDGYQTSLMIFRCEFGVKFDAWAELSTT